MKVVPTTDGSGTVPLRTSKNPVLGVYRHHCGNIATVHQPKGHKSHLRYLLCDECGTDQGSGKVYQEKIRANMFPSIEALTEAGQLPIDEPVSTDDLTEKLTEQTPLETSTDAVVTVTEPIAERTPVSEPVLTEESTYKVNEQKPVIDQTPAKTNDIKPVRVGFAALLGGVIGGLLALVV